MNHSVGYKRPLHVCWACESQNDKKSLWFLEKKKLFCIPLESCLCLDRPRLLFTTFSGFFLAFSLRSDICPWHRHKKGLLYISQDLRLYKGQWWAQFVIISSDCLLRCEALWCPTESHLVNQALCQPYKCFHSLWVCEMEVCVRMFNPSWIKLQTLSMRCSVDAVERDKIHKLKFWGDVNSPDTCRL